MGREGIQNIQLVEGNTSNLQTNLADQGSRRDLRRSYLDKNLQENESGETELLYGWAKDQNLRFRSRSKQVIDHEDAEQGELQSVVPVAVPVPNHEHQMSEDVSIWSTLWRVVNGYLGFCLAGQFHRSFAITFFVLKAIPSLGYLLIEEYFPLHLILVGAFLDLIEIILTIHNRHNYPLEILFFSSVQLIVTCSHFLLVFKNKRLTFIVSVFRLVYFTILVVLFGIIKPSQDYHKPSDPDDLRVQIDEDHHGSLQNDFSRSPDDLASRVSETDRQTLRHDQSQDIQREDEDMDGRLPGKRCSLMIYLHHKYNKRAIAVLFLILEGISCLLDFTGKAKLGFIVAAFVLALLVFFPTLWVYFKERSTRLPDQRPIANVELLFSGIQLLTTLLHLIFELKGVDDKYNLYNQSFLPLAFAFYRVFSVVFAFRKEHENGIHNAAEPPAANQVNQLHYGSRNIMVHTRVTGKHLHMVIDLTMVTCYEQLFRKLRDEIFQAEKELWGDRPRWDVLYLDISNEAHYLREDEISWGEFCMAARKICIYRKEVRKELYRRWESMPRTSEKGSERALFT